MTLSNYGFGEGGDEVQVDSILFGTEVASPFVGTFVTFGASGDGDKRYDINSTDGLDYVIRGDLFYNDTPSTDTQIRPNNAAGDSRSYGLNAATGNASNVAFSELHICSSSSPSDLYRCSFEAVIKCRQELASITTPFLYECISGVFREGYAAVGDTRVRAPLFGEYAPAVAAALTSIAVHIPTGLVVAPSLLSLFTRKRR